MLRAIDRAAMQTFSRRTVEGLTRHSLFGLMLPAFQTFLATNVRKEIDKDQRVIDTAAAALRAGRAPAAADAEQLLHDARAIDQAFVRDAAPFPISLDIRYPDIEPTRRQRIERLLTLSYRLLDHWQATPRLRQAVAQAYPREQFHAALREILHLYALETRLLNRSVRLPALIGMARDRLAETIYSEMKAVADLLANELTEMAYRRGR